MNKEDYDKLNDDEKAIYEESKTPWEDEYKTPWDDEE